MKYSFPVVTTIDPFLKAIENSDEFVVKRDTNSGILIVNYLFASPTTFPDPNLIEDETEAFYAKLRRECRGIEFDIDTGEIVTRKYHKFFNCNEKPETQVGQVNWAQNHHVYEKLDGSLISCYLNKKTGRMEWHTKMGNTDVAQPVYKFVDQSNSKYENFVRECIEQNLSPLFEWCSIQQRIVLGYPVENLILTAIRHRNTGQYMGYETMYEMAKPYGVPVVKVFGSVSNIDEFLSKTRQLVNAEGYVLRFADGHALKIKSDWYVAIHNTKEVLSREKSVWSLILENRLDDAKPMMQEHDRRVVEKFATEFEQAILVLSNRLSDFVKAAKNLVQDKKEFALKWVSNAPTIEKSMLFLIWDGASPREVVLSFLRKHVGTQTKVDEVRSLMNGLKWSDFYSQNSRD